MKKLLLLVMVVVAAWVGMTWGNVTVEGASAFKSPQKPPKQVTKYTFQGEGAVAEFSYSDNCISTFGYITAREAVSKGGGKPAPISSAFIYISYYDNCTGTSLFTFGDVSLSPEAFSMQGKLGSATLNTEVQVCCDQNGSFFPATLNVTWTATGPITKGKSSYTTHSSGCKISYKAQGESRSAVANGSLTAPNTGLTLPSSLSATLSSSTEGSMEVGCD